MATRRATDTEEAVGGLLRAYPPEVQAVALRVRELILRTLPRAEETVDSSSKLLGYGYGSGYRGVVCTLILSKAGVKLGVFRGAELPDPERLLAGSGKVHRHIPFKLVEDVERRGVTQLLAEALAAWQLRSGEGAVGRTLRKVEGVQMDDPLVETWEINARINIYLVGALPSPALSAGATSGGRTVGEALAHMHNVRLMWLKAAAPDLLIGLEKFEKGSSISSSGLVKALNASTAAITELVARSLSGGGKIKGFKPHVHAFVGYLVSHESHHRGQIALALEQSGKPLEKTVSFGLWEWGSR